MITCRIVKYIITDSNFTTWQKHIEKQRYFYTHGSVFSAYENSII